MPQFVVLCEKNKVVWVCRVREEIGRPGEEPVFAVQLGLQILAEMPDFDEIVKNKKEENIGVQPLRFFKISKACTPMFLSFLIFVRGPIAPQTPVLSCSSCQRRNVQVNPARVAGARPI